MITENPANQAQIKTFFRSLLCASLINKRIRSESLP